MISDPQIDKMAASAIAGMDPRVWLHTESDLEVAALDRIADRMIEIHRLQRQELAERIIMTLDKALSKGKKSKKG